MAYMQFRRRGQSKVHLRFPNRFAWHPAGTKSARFSKEGIVPMHVLRAKKTHPYMARNLIIRMETAGEIRRFPLRSQGMVVTIND